MSLKGNGLKSLSLSVRVLVVSFAILFRSKVYSDDDNLASPVSAKICTRRAILDSDKPVAHK